MRLLAFTRPVPASLPDCELTHVSRVPIDLSRARAQHAAYEQTLVSLGCELRRLPAADDLPDSVFVEDTAVVLDEIVVITRPGASSRRGETDAVATALGAIRPLRSIEPPATLDGGDVLRLGRTLHVGVGGRTNEAGASQLAALVQPFGYSVQPVSVNGCLHLKSAVTEAAPGIVLVNPAWIDPTIFASDRTIAVHPEEPFAANVLRVGGAALAAQAHPRTNARLREAGVALRTTDISELAKAEAALTCCSLLASARAREAE